MSYSSSLITCRILWKFQDSQKLLTHILKKSVTTLLCPLRPQILPLINLHSFSRLFHHEYGIISALKSLNSYRKAVEIEIKIRTVRVEETKERPEVFWLALTSKQALWLVEIYIGKISWLISVSSSALSVWQGVRIKFYI